MRLTILFVATLLAIIPSYGRASGRSPSSRSSTSRSVGVRAYKRRDGTPVSSYTRSRPSTNNKSSATSASRSPRTRTSAVSSSRSTRSARVAGGSTKAPIREPARNRCASCTRDSRHRIQRSSTAKHEFERSHPCPSTGRTSGPCSGYVVDHVKPLKRGGADTPSNMQWQTKDAARAKDKIE
jgi:hypothetical protein